MTRMRQKKADRKAQEEQLFSELAEQMTEDPRCHEMKQFIQHGTISTYDHCLSVAKMSYRMNRRLHLHCREDALIKGAFLHDYFLYDWHHHDKRWHGFTHPAKAAENAARDFALDSKERNIIESHMWPLTLLHLPRSREAAVVCMADKICSLRETLLCRSESHKSRE